MPPTISGQSFSSVSENVLGYADKDIDEVEIRFEWEVPHIIKSTSKELVWNPEEQVVLLQDPAARINYMATTCAEYLREYWNDDDAGAVLGLLSKFIEAFDENRSEALDEDRTEASWIRDTDRYAQVNIPFALEFAAAAILGPMHTAIAVVRSAISGQLLTSETGDEFLEARIPNTSGATIKFLDSMVVLHFFSLGEVRETMTFINAWDWLCKAVRQGPPTQTISSTASYEWNLSARANSKNSLCISSHLCSIASADIEHYCWERLFQSWTFVVCEIRPRNEFGKGLEMSFDLMLSLAATEFHSVIDGGVVFIGYRTILFPTSIYKNSVQFHLLTQDKGQINPYIQKYGDRHLIEDWDELRTMRCFLGWCTNAQINLGTEKLPASIRYSGGVNKAKSIHLDGYATTIQAGSSAPLSAILGVQSSFKYLSHKLHFTPASEYIQLLHDTAKETALVYDSYEQRCWLVPKLSLLLHMSQAYAAHHGCPGGRVPLVEPHSDAADIAVGLESLGDVPIFGEGKNAFRFHQLVLRLNTNLLRTVDLTKPGERGKLYGFELMDIITQPGRGSYMKELKLELSGKFWIEVTTAVDAVLVCAGLGDAITAADEARTGNKQCNKLPKSHDYLAATISCLKILIEREGKTLDGELEAQHLPLSKKSFWDLSKNPFSTCNHNSCPGRCWENVKVFQRLTAQPSKLRNFRKSFGKPQPEPTAIQIPVSGAVVFGNPPEAP